MTFDKYFITTILGKIFKLRFSMLTKLIREFLTLFKVQWKIIKLEGKPTVSIYYRDAKPGTIHGYTYQGTDWTGIRFDDDRGVCVANFYDTNHTNKYVDCHNCLWWGTLVRDPEDDDKLCLVDVKIRKIIHQ